MDASAPIPPTPLTSAQVELLTALIQRLAAWEKLLTLGKPGANRLRQIIRAERLEYEAKLGVPAVLLLKGTSVGKAPAPAPVPFAAADDAGGRP